MPSVNWDRATMETINSLTVGELLSLNAKDRRTVQNRVKNEQRALETYEREQTAPFRTAQVCGEPAMVDGKRKGFKDNTGVTGGAKYHETMIPLAVMRTAQEMANGATAKEAVERVLLSKLFIGRGSDKCSAGALSVKEGDGDTLLEVIVTTKPGRGMETFKATVPKSIPNPIEVNRHTVTHQVAVQGSEA